jgi:arylsulfatase A-like enzyme
MPQPNVLLLHADQQRFDTIAALGASHMHTPNMDRLVERGTTFTRAYSSNPVCMAACHDLLTGVSGRYHGYWGNSRSFIKDCALQTVPRMLAEADYQTVAIGKVHHRPEREHHGWSHILNMEELPSCRENDGYLQYLEREGYGHIRCQHGVRPLFYHVPQVPRVPRVPEEHHGSAWIAHEVIDWIKRDRDRSLFMFASWVAPHPPLYVPQNHLDMYRDRPLPDVCGAPEWSARQVPSTPENVEEFGLQRIQEAYFAAITLIDTHVGRILDALEETGQIDNTVIVFTSDHGEMLGDRGGYQKYVPFEGWAHIPMIVCGPGIGQGVCDTPVTTWDMVGDPGEQINIIDHDPEMADALRDVCLDFEVNAGPVENTREGAFVDADYKAPSPHTCSLHPSWSYRQFPPWTNGYSQEDLDLIENEMRSCLEDEAVFIHTDPEWLKGAVDEWTGMGGDAGVMEEIFTEADARSGVH